MRSFLLALSIVCSCAAFAAADETPLNGAADPDSSEANESQAKLSKQVAYLVRQLDAGSLAERDEAEADLMDLGPVVLDWLPEVTDRTPAEVKARLERITTVLQKQQADSVTQPQLVTLDFNQAPLKEVLAEIEKQSGNRIVDFRPNFGQQTTNPLITIQCEKTLFWEAIDRVFADANLAAYPYAGEKNALAFINRDAPGLPLNLAAYSGVFRVEPTRIEMHRNFVPPASDGMRVNLQVTWEPHLAPILVKFPFSELVATDDQGTDLKLADGPVTYDVAVDSGQTSVDFVIPLNVAPRGSQMIQELKGELVSLVPGRVETFRFERLANARGLRQEKGGVQVALEQFRKNRDLFDARIIVRFPGGSEALQSHLGWVDANEVYLEAADGERLKHAGYERFLEDSDAIGIAYKFILDDRQPDDFTLVYKTPGSIVSLPVEFQLDDIPLP
ncbi:hypothetical protein [Blastopirellula retiformator]|uniref:Uncharacterized protein n=1 Tax=Blastopirellula retiformator TaxID=2527970 RepID=A0A5C5V3L3_9BACT|nr:hypothetical protein [Blastopirellula retiformator]TWT32610.1 hypothetical protein Enr8_24150 [Blastopirellula retiformator]